jgi:hypothetical protein
VISSEEGGSAGYTACTGYKASRKAGFDSPFIRLSTTMMFALSNSILDEVFWFNAEVKSWFALDARMAMQNCLMMEGERAWFRKKGRYALRMCIAADLFHNFSLASCESQGGPNLSHAITHG